MRINIILIFVLSLFIINPALGQSSSKRVIISGTVLDSNQKPIKGAIIFIDNQKTNTETDEKGFYKIKVSQKAKSISVFTLLNGLNKAEIGGRTTINFELKAAGSSQKSSDQNQLNDETVNVGYGTMKKKDLTTQVGKIDGANKKYLSYQNIYDMIRGELPGVQVIGQKIVIQGPSSINLPSDPLLVVDGITVNSIDDISPQNVKSIEVLKGAAASIYGSRGSNGVILIYLKGAPERKK
jgi:TonB-dependent SusC/RagA subfamily outer membrane receptor